MKIVGTMPVRNEGWILGYSIRAAMRWLDHLVVLLHCCDSSIDKSTSIVTRCQQLYPNRITILAETNKDWDEATYRQRMLTAAREVGATHIALTDADEALTLPVIKRIRTVAEAMSPCQCLRLPWLCLWRGQWQYREDASRFGQARVPVLVRDGPNLTFQPGPGNYQIHTRVPVGAVVEDWLARAEGGVFHWQHANWSRLLAKQALYKMTELLRWHKPAEEINNRYDPTVAEDGVHLETVPTEWHVKEMVLVNMEASPWQAAECRRLVREYGRERFVGLNLHGGV